MGSVPDPEKAFVRFNGLRDYQILNSTLNEKGLLVIDVLMRDDDDMPFVYHPRFDTKNKIIYCAGLPVLICEAILLGDFVGIYGRPTQFRP